MLLDHFHPPISNSFAWKSFHNQWAAVLAADLNERLPPGWRAATEVEFGIEIDVGVVDEELAGESTNAIQSPWKPPSPTLTIPFVSTTDRVEIRIVNASYSPSLMGAIELVSPANKDRPEHRDAFVAKCLSIASEGAGLAIVDIVTDRRANLHQMFMDLVGEEGAGSEGELYATAYFPVRNDEQSPELQVWQYPLEIGAELPVIPLHLRVGPVMAIDLGLTYRRTCNQLRIPLNQPNGH